MIDPWLEEYRRILEESQSVSTQTTTDPLLQRYRDILNQSETAGVKIESIAGLKYEKPDIATILRMKQVEEGEPQLPLEKQVARKGYAFLYGLGAEGTLGFGPKVLGLEELPEPTETEQLIEQVGRFIGFLGLPIKGAGLIVKGGEKLLGKYVTKGLLKLIPGVSKKLGGQAVKALGKYFAREAATLGIASGLAEIGERPEETPERAVSGAKIGTVFALTGLLTPTKYPALNMIVRQIGSRVLGKLAGEYSFEGISPQTFFNELLYTYFSLRGRPVQDVIARELRLYEKELNNLAKEAQQKIARKALMPAPTFEATETGQIWRRGEVINPQEIIRNVKERITTEVEPIERPIEKPVERVTEAERKFTQQVYEKLRTGKELTPEEKRILSEMGIYEEVKPGIAEGAIETRVTEGLREIPTPETQEVYFGIDPFKGLKELDKTLLESAQKYAREQIKKEVVKPRIKEEVRPEPVEGVVEFRPNEPYVLPTNRPVEIVKQFNENSQVLARHEVEPLKNVRDLPPKKLKWWIENPIRIFEDYPILKKLIYDPIKTAEDRQAREFDNIKKTVKEFKRMKNVSSRRLGIYAIAQQKGGKAILESMGIKKIPKLTPQEQQIYNQVRGILEETFNQINRARELAGLEPIKKVENYFTFMRNAATLEQLGHSLIAERDMKVLETHLNAPAFKYAIPRKHIKAPVELDFFNVFTNYMNTALRFIHKAPVIAKGRLMLSDVTLPTGERISLREQAPILANEVEQWLDYNAGQMVREQLPAWFKDKARKLSRNIGTSVLSFNVRPGLIQPTALRNSYIILGERFFADGLIRNVIPSQRKFALENSRVLKSRKFDVHATDIFTNNPGKLRSILLSKPQEAIRFMAQKGLLLMKWLDMEAATATWLGAYRKAITPRNKGGLGLSKSEARIYADDIVTKTQASAQPSDIAKIQRTTMGRLATIFQTFVINEWNFLSKEVFRAKIPPGEKVARIARLVLATAIINALFEKGLNIRSPFPSPEWAVQRAIEEGKETKQVIGEGLKEMMEQVPIIGGAIRWSTPYRTAWPAALQVAEGTMQLLTKMLTQLDPTKLNKQDLETIGRLLGIPGTSQVMKYLRRRQKGMSHAEAIIGIRQD